MSKDPSKSTHGAARDERGDDVRYCRTQVGADDQGPPSAHWPRARRRVVASSLGGPRGRNGGVEWLLHALGDEVPALISPRLCKSGEKRHQKIFLAPPRTRHTVIIRNNQPCRKGSHSEE